MDVHEHPHVHFDFTFVLLLHLVYLETSTVIDLIQFGQINVASFDLFIWTVLIISSFPTKVHVINDKILDFCNAERNNQGYATFKSLISSSCGLN